MKRTIRLHRPEDPELQRQYDEAAQAVRDRKIPLIIDDETRPLWECAKRAAAEVAAWPAWKRNELPKTDHRDVNPHNLELDLADSGSLGERPGFSRWRWRCSCGAKGTWRSGPLAAALDGQERVCRPHGCRCHQEAGDSICAVHPPDAAELAYAESIGAPYSIPRDADCCLGDITRCRCCVAPVAMSDEDVDREKWAAVWNDGDE